MEDEPQNNDRHIIVNCLKKIPLLEQISVKFFHVPCFTLIKSRHTFIRPAPPPASCVERPL